MQRRADDVALTIGSSIGPYRLTGLIGQGGMGIVYVAEHTLIGKKVAVKTVRPELVEHQGVAERFINEARAVNTIGDEHIVDIFDAGQTADGALYCVMELLVGESLQDFQKRNGRIPLQTALHVSLQIARALHACHLKQIVHRDLKPGNIFIIQRGGAPFVKILDFGIAKLIGQSSSATHSNAIIGTPFYMAPEQCRGSKDLDHRIDIYALGVILYELCTGTLPFEGDSAGDVIIKQATEMPEDPCLRSPELPEWLCHIILRALEKNRDKRFRDMEEFAAALESHAMPGPYVPPSRGAAPSVPSYPSTPGGSYRGSPTQSIHMTPTEYQASRSETFEPAVTPGPAGSARRSRPGASSSRVEPEPKRGVPRVLLVVAAVVVIGLVIVAGRYVVSPPETAASASPASPPPSAPSALVTSTPAPPATEPRGPSVFPAQPTSTAEPTTAIRPVPIDPAPPVTTVKVRPGGKRVPTTQAPPKEVAPVVVPVEPPPPSSPKKKPPESMLPPPEPMLPEQE